MRSDRSQKATSVDQEDSEVAGREDDSPPRDKDEEAEAVPDRVARVVVVTDTISLHGFFLLQSSPLEYVLVVAANWDISYFPGPEDEKG